MTAHLTLQMTLGFYPLTFILQISLRLFSTLSTGSIWVIWIYPYCSCMRVWHKCICSCSYRCTEQAALYITQCWSRLSHQHVVNEAFLSNVCWSALLLLTDQLDHLTASLRQKCSQHIWAWTTSNLTDSVVARESAGCCQSPKASW